MAEYKIKIGKLQLILFRGNRRVKLALGVVLLLTAAALGALHLVTSQMAAETADMRSQAAEIEYENQELELSIEQIDSITGIERIAQEELGLVSGDTMLIDAQVK